MSLTSFPPSWKWQVFKNHKARKIKKSQPLPEKAFCPPFLPAPTLAEIIYGGYMMDTEPFDREISSWSLPKINPGNYTISKRIGLNPKISLNKSPS
jgi:hypothetical protein